MALRQKGKLQLAGQCKAGSGLGKEEQYVTSSYLRLHRPQSQQPQGQYIIKGCQQVLKTSVYLCMQMHGRPILNMNKHLGKQQPAGCRIKPICQTNTDVYINNHIKKKINCISCIELFMVENIIIIIILIMYHLFK